MMDQSHQLIKIFCGSKMMEHQHHVNNGKCTELQVNSYFSFWIFSLIWNIRIESSPVKLKIYLAENHADVFFSVAQLPRMNGEGTQTVIAVGAFYAQRLELVWTEDPDVSQKFNSRAIKWTNLSNLGQLEKYWPSKVSFDWYCWLVFWCSLPRYDNEWKGIGQKWPDRT